MQLFSRHHKQKPQCYFLLETSLLSLYLLKPDDRSGQLAKAG